MTSLDLTYEMIRDSYTLIVQQLDALENRIHSVMVFSASFLLTGPALAAVTSNGISFNSNWFYAAIALAVVNIAIGLTARNLGTIYLPRIHDVDSGWLELEVEEFKRSSIWWANQNLDHNITLVKSRARASLLMTLVLLAEVALLITWGLIQV